MNWWDNDPVASIADARELGNGGSNKGGGLSVQDNKALNEMRPSHGAALGVNRDYREVARALDRSKMTPAKASWLETWIPRENGGLFDMIGGAIGQRFLDPQTVTDFQTLRSLQSKRVMDAQVEQKGPQTESDAARLQLTEVSPYKTKQANIGVMRRGMADATLAKRKLPFFQQWAGKYGLNGMDPQGRTVDQAWGQVADAVYKAGNNLGQAPRLGRRTSSQPTKISGDDDYNRLPSGARFIAPDGSLRTKP